MDPSEIILKTLCNNISEGIFVLDANGQIILINQQGADLIQHPFKELQNQPIYSFLDESFAKIYRDYLEQLKINLMQKKRHEIQFKRKDGTILDLIVDLIPLSVENVESFFVLSILTNLTETDLITNKLLETSFEGIALHESGKIIDVNDSFLKMFGYERSDLIGKNALEFGTPETRQKMIEHVKAGDESPYEAVGVRKDGTQFFVEMVGKGAKYKGRPIRVAAFRDITVRKTFEEALKESEAKYRLLFESNISGVGISNVEGKIFEANAAWCKMTGYSREEMLQLRAPQLYEDPHDRKKFLEPITKEAEIRNYEVRFKRKDGTILWVSLSSRVIKMNGELRLLTTIIDIDQVKKAEETLKQLYQEAVEVSKIKSDLITFASHELKTPLIPIIGWADFLRKEISEGKNISEITGKEEIDSIYRSAKRLGSIINNFLDFGRIETNRLQLEMKMQSIRKIMDAAIKNIADTMESQDGLITNELPEIKLLVDASHVEEVFTNILSNAIKYSSPNSPIRIYSESKKEIFTIFIQDQGYGFTGEELQNLWQLFSISASRGKTGYSGTGVGLYLSKKIMELHKGTIEITSPGRNQGSIVILKFPKRSQVKKKTV